MIVVDKKKLRTRRKNLYVGKFTQKKLDEIESFV